MSEVTLVRKGHRAVKVSWAKLVTLTKEQREALFLRNDQYERAKANEDVIKAAKAQRKATHIANMQRVADAKRRR